ncbi:MAG: lamin tail domain-containing protein, partial [Bacteroidales bacterium]|nr:lamin tail domain-containing protein [Bacteroidales bacterium]
MRKLYYILTLAVIAVGCKDKIHMPSAADFEGVIITEVAANADKPATDSWVEIYNTSSRDISLAGLGLYVFDGESDGDELTIMDEMSIRAGERLVFSTADMTLLRGISSDSDFELVLGVSADKDIV